MGNIILSLVLALFSLFYFSKVNAVECNNHNGFICDDNAFQFDASFTQAEQYPYGALVVAIALQLKRRLFFYMETVIMH
ncbi:hypothetical protein [Shewanella marina]|uniref:hypothetical protein n=1 Tax=Shewanella marina TaxID=487319 RepID=UPI0006888869|nr:hypothetical protein [Shewanella marina]